MNISTCPNYIYNFFYILKKFTKKIFYLFQACEYFIKLDGYYYCQRRKCNIAILRVRNKRTIEKIPIIEIINDKEYLKEFHSLDACILGIIANNERNGIFDKNIGWNKMIRSKNYFCSKKSKPILEISKRYTDSNGNEICILRAKSIKKEITIPTLDLCKNQALLYALDTQQAIALGYDTSELFLRNLSHDKK